MSRWRKVGFFLTLFFIQYLSASSNDNPEIVQDFIVNPKNNERIEFFILKPQGDGPFPVIFLLHGHQFPENNIGGKQLVDLDYLEKFAIMGIVAVSVSKPGFGGSTGKRDFAGPHSQQAIALVIDHFNKLPYIDAKKMGIYGISKGATLASMVHMYTSKLALQILESGMYDLTNCCALMPAYLKGIKDTIIEETGNTPEELKARSAVYHTQNVPSKTLILQGEFDDRRGLTSAITLHEKILCEGKFSELKVFPNEFHILPPSKWKTISRFVRENFLQLFGIGIEVAVSTPVIQIAKIYPGSPADLSGKLEIGDAILQISPNNNDIEIDALCMSEEKFISLVLGKKGTKLRLHVQHFDLSFEDVIILRN